MNFPTHDFFDKQKTKRAGSSGVLRKMKENRK